MKLAKITSTPMATTTIPRKKSGDGVLPSPYVHGGGGIAIVVTLPFVRVDMSVPPVGPVHITGLGNRNPTNVTIKPITMKTKP